MAMEAEELNHSFESNQRSRTGFASALQMGAKGPHRPMNDSAMYSTALSGFHGSVQGDLYRSRLHKHLLPLALATEDLFNGQQKDDAMASGETHREPKRRKEGPNQGPCPSLPAHGNQESSDHPSSATSMSFQQALLQHALQGLNQSQSPGSSQSPQSVQRISTDISRRSSNEALGTSPSMLPSETGPTEISDNIHGSHINTPHFKLKNAEAFSKSRTPTETYPTRSSSEAEVINNSSTPHLRLTSKSSNDFPRYLVHSTSPVHSNSPKVLIETAHQPCGNASPQNMRTAHAREGIHAFDVTSRQLAVKAWGNMPLSCVDPYLFSIMEREKIRQWKGIELIASENFTSLAVMEVLGSHLVNKYSEGLPGSRYYGGNECIDQIESLCRERALIAFHLDPEAWGVNVQLYSCTSANFAVYTGLLQPKDRIMGLDSPSGGHLSHGYYTSSGKKVSAASIFFENLPYKVNPDSGYIDYDKLEEKALDYRPKILICGGSAYPREWDYARFRCIADKVGAILMCDMAHISGLVAAQECCSPFDYCDIVTTTTHKSLRGPRGGMIFYRRGLKPKKRGLAISADETENYDYEDRVNFAVFPSLQGGPHNNQVGALAVALKQVATPEFKSYIQQVKKNAQALSSALQKRGCKLVTDGTDNHLLLWDLRAYGVSGYQYERVCELCQITLNKNAVFGDSATFAPGGVRIGTPAMTSRGCVEADFEVISEFLLRALQIAIGLPREHGKQNKEFLRSMQTSRDLEELKRSVEKFACSFEMPAFHTTALKS